MAYWLTCKLTWLETDLVCLILPLYLSTHMRVSQTLNIPLTTIHLTRLAVITWASRGFKHPSEISKRKGRSGFMCAGWGWCHSSPPPSLLSLPCTPSFDFFASIALCGAKGIEPIVRLARCVYSAARWPSQVGASATSEILLSTTSWSQGTSCAFIS